MSDTLWDLSSAEEPEVTHGCAGAACLVCAAAPDHRRGRTRTNDHVSSEAGAESVAYRAGSQKAKLLAAFKAAPDGLTDEEAAEVAGLLRSCFWKRCGELREDGVITPTGAYRMGEAGVQRMVCRSVT